MSYLSQSGTVVVGLDIFISQKEIPKIGPQVGSFELSVISNRGNKVWPGEAPPVELCDVFCCRFKKSGKDSVTAEEVSNLLGQIEKAGLQWVHIEKLLVINGKNGFSTSDGEK